MKYLKIAFGLIVVAGLMAVMAGPALAEEYRWVGCEEKAGAGKWEDNKCEKAKAGGNWETKEPAVGKEVTIATIPGQSLTFEDTGAKTAMECQGGGTAKLNAKGTGEIVALTATSCKFVAGKNGACEASKPVTAKATHLPWKTKLEEAAGGEVRNAIENSGTGLPAYEVECTVAGIFKVNDKCEGNTSTSIKRRTSAAGGEGTVEGAFDEKSPLANCSVGGEKTGKMAGISLLRLRFITLIWWWFLGLKS
jgi:hypothetical protein